MFLKRVFLFAALAWAWAGSAAADYVFVFYDEGTTAGVYDADTLELVASPEVGAGARQAVGVPDASDPTRLVNIYIVSSNAVRVLEPEPPFETIRARTLNSAVNAGEQPAVLTPDARRLLVPSGNSLVIFNAQNRASLSTQSFDYGRDDMDRDRVITSIAAAPSGEFAWLSLAHSKAFHAVRIDSDRPRQLRSSDVLEEVPAAIAAAPNGAGIYAVSSAGLHNVDPSSNEIRGMLEIDTRRVRDFDADSAFIDFHGGEPLNRLILTHGNTISMPTIATFTLEYGASAPFAADKILAPTQDRLYLLNRADKQIFEHVIGEEDFTMLQDPRTRAALRPSAVDMEFDLAAQNLFVLDEDELLRFSAATDEIRAAVDLPRAPAGFSVLSAAGGAPDAIAVYGGDNQEADSSGSIPWPAAVRVTDANGVPVFGAEVDFSSPTANTGFDPPSAVTNRFGVALTEISASTDRAFSVRAQTAGSKTATFSFNDGPVGKGALTVLSGDLQAAAAGAEEPSPLPRGIRLRIVGAGARIPNSRFDITSSRSSVKCPSDVDSSTGGILFFSCETGVVPPRESSNVARIDVRDDAGRGLAEPLDISVVPEEDANDLLPGLTRIPQDMIRGAAGQTLENAVELRLDLPRGVPRLRVGAEFDVDDDDITPIPRIAGPADRDGFIRADLKLGCRLGSGSFTATLSVPDLPEATFNYEIVRGPMHALVPLRGNHQSGLPGERLPLALVARIADSCGNPFDNVPVTWQVTPPDAATLESQRPASNDRGQISTLVHLGSRPGRFSVTASASGAAGVVGVTFSLTVIDPTPPGVSAAFVNGASFAPGWTPGSLGSIFSAGLLSGIEGVVVASANAAPPAVWPTSLRNIRVLVNGEPAPIFSMAVSGNGREQINIQVPFSTPAPAAAVAVAVENNGSPISFTGPQTFAVQPGIFEYTPTGTTERFAAALHTDYSLAGTANPARPGEIIQLYFTGGGPTDPAVPTNAAASSPTTTMHPASVTIDGAAQATSGDYLGSFYAPGLVSVYQVNFRVGEDTADGDREIRIEQNGVPSRTSKLPVRR